MAKAKRNNDGPRLFKENLVPADPGSDEFFKTEYEGSRDGAVECLGMTFPSDEKRREYFTDKLREKLKDPEFRKIEGFPIGADEDILALSDPPYYTACPNPFIADMIHFWRNHKPPIENQTSYSREPFAVDVSEGKTHPIYKAHSYHTKVPHLAIVPSILHYTEPGDIVLDGFAGSGMTGVAAQWCGAAPADYRMQLERHWQDEGHPPPVWGARRCVLNDLAPAATVISANYNLPFDVPEFARVARQLLKETDAEIGWMYETLHADGKTKGRIEYTVWSEVFTCPECAGEVIFLDEALDEETKRVKESFLCPHCHADVGKRSLDKAFETRFDTVTGETIQSPKRRPSLICYQVGKAKYEKKPDAADFALLAKIAGISLPPEVPVATLPYMHMTHERARMDRAGITHIHHFFLPRAAQALGTLWHKAKAHPDTRIRHMLMFWLDSHLTNLSIQNRYRPEVSFPYNPLSGVYYIPSLISEASPFTAYVNKLARMEVAWRVDHRQVACVSACTGSASALQLPDTCIDYIFTDPPFGENIYYADLNFLVESWYGVFSNSQAEAIVDKAKKKGLPEYQELMRRCFAEYYRVLKAGRWITIVFHNSRNTVWNAIQEALQVAGFVVADVRTLDKQQGSYRQVTSTAVKQDLVISAYKPNGGLEGRFSLTAGTEEGAWDFVRTHLRQLPTFVAKEKRAEIIAERLGHLLYDRMVAFHVQRGVTVPLSSAEFLAGLAQRFAERDGMYFLPDQVAEYDRKRMTATEIEQLEIFVTDENSAIQWLRQLLKDKPQSFQDIHPQFIKEHNCPDISPTASTG